MSTDLCQNTKLALHLAVKLHAVMMRYLLLLMQSVQFVQDYLWSPCWPPLGARTKQDVNIQQSAGLSDLQQEE